MATSKSLDEKKLGQGFVDLRKKTVFELKELLERQNTLLHSSTLFKLPDKGARIINFKNQIEEEIERRDGAAVTCDLLSELKISNADEIEWNEGSTQGGGKLDSDDESDAEVDPLKLLATHSGTVNNHKRQTKVKAVQSLVTKEDVECEAYTHDVNICDKFGDVKAVDKFRTNVSQTKPDVASWYANTGDVVKQHLGAHWEVTAATPPVPVFGSAVMISLGDSLQLQKEQAQKLKEIEMKQAAEKLARHTGIKMGATLPTSNIKDYRSQPVDDSFEGSVWKEDVDGEVYDTEDKEEKGAVFYNLIDDNVRS